MSFTFVQSFSGMIAGAADAWTWTDYLDDVQAGDLLVAIAKWEGGDTTLSVSDGTSTFNADHVPQSFASGDGRLAIRYLLSSVATGQPDYTFTWGAARAYRAMMMLQFRPTAAVTFGGVTGAEGNSADPNSGNLVVSGADILAIGALGSYAQATSSAHLVNGQAADGVLTPQYAAAWHKTFAAGFTGAAAAALPGTDQWGALLAYFRIGAGGAADDSGLLLRRRRD